ncbi:MAG TPA: hypothetical protein VE397_01330 [Stellaceae bacterium]|jgi:hypothetical protein|nr:hypothetical protein [Stellaceae bacterium]
MLRVSLFLLAFALFTAIVPIIGWTLPMKLYAAALTAGGASFLV